MAILCVIAEIGWQFEVRYIPDSNSWRRNLNDCLLGNIYNFKVSNK